MRSLTSAAFVLVAIIAAGCSSSETQKPSAEAPAAGTTAATTASNEGPSFDCSVVEAGSIEEMVCNDPALAALDRKLDAAYKQAGEKARNERPPVLAVEQRGWIKGRNDCWKADDKRACVESEYSTRTAELQARYRLVAANGPLFYACEGDPRNEIVATFFKTDPPSLIAERGDSTSFMISVPAGSGTKYQGRNESFWDHQGEAAVAWGYGAKELKCVQKKNQ